MSYSQQTVDLSLRKVRYFIAVAEELHFGRAANRLYIAQQSLSAQIRELEQEVGVQLLFRTTRKVELTRAGEIFLAAAKEALATLERGVDEALSAARGETGRIRVGFTVGAALELTRLILSEARDQMPGVLLELREFDFGDTSAGLADGWADVAFLRPPISATGIELETLFIEPRCVALTKDHPLASREYVEIEEVLALPIAVAGTGDRVWQEFWSLGEYRTGAMPPRVMFTHSQTEENEIVASGAACSITPASVARITPHVDVRHVRIRGITGSASAIGWQAERRTELVDRFVEIACRVRDREADLVKRIESGLGETG